MLVDDQPPAEAGGYNFRHLHLMIAGGRLQFIRVRAPQDIACALVTPDFSRGQTDLCGSALATMPNPNET